MARCLVILLLFDPSLPSILLTLERDREELGNKIQLMKIFFIEKEEPRLFEEVGVLKFQNLKPNYQVGVL